MDGPYDGHTVRMIHIKRPPHFSIPLENRPGGEGMGICYQGSVLRQNNIFSRKFVSRRGLGGEQSSSKEVIRAFSY